MFTAGIQSTSRVEAMNSIIASDTNRSTGLCQLFNVLMGRCDLEAESVLINQQLQKQPNISLPTVYNTIYKSIDEEIQSYLLPNMHNRVRDQISESFLYTAQQFNGNLEEYINLQGDIDNTTEGYLEEMYKKPQINLKTLLECVEQQSITSLWIIRPMVSNTSITRSISIVQEESYIDNPLTPKCQILSILRGKVIDTEPVKKLSKQKQQFIEGHECVTKALNLAIKTDSVDELVGLCNRFMSSHIHLNTQQTNGTYQNDPNHIPNPIVYNVRGRPPKRLKSAVEIARNKRPFKEITNVSHNDEQNAETSAAAAEVNLSRGQRKCKNCGKLGHYRKNCGNNA
ncbi:uncharacterized protein OCT59_001581 [Rhizophagus irregularis]|uniref:uncharacterized protein n=1 Tax=Rhizophagus irregularis TaxID=588596 RepID=UPI0033343706|nr:hypothetical protein OCT59_001581 [Rhizophagus irregularis]